MEKMTFRQKIENLWYHNKVAIIVVPIFLAFIIIATVQLFTKDEPDANLLYMGPAAVAFKGEGYLQESISTVMREDYNDDGKKYVDYIELTALDPDDTFDDETGDFATGYTSYDVQRTVGEAFAAQIIAGDSMIYLLDEKYYGVAEETGVLMPLSEALGYTPDFAVNEYAVYLRDLDLYFLPGFNLLPETTMICIRYPVTLTNGKKEVEQRERCNLSVFRDMISYVYADKPKDEALPEPKNLSLDETRALLLSYSEKKKLGLTEDDLLLLTDVSPEGFFDLTGANLFRLGNVTYLAHLEKIYVLGKAVGGDGLQDVKIFDLNIDGKNDIIFSYTYKEGENVISGVSVFNFTTKKETFLSLTSPLSLSFEEGGEGEIKVLEAGKVIATVYGDGKDVLIKFIG